MRYVDARVVRWV